MIAGFIIGLIMGFVAGAIVVLITSDRNRPNHSNSLVDHYRCLDERHHREALWYRAQLFDAWKVIRGQGKGLKRQARHIKRLRAEQYGRGKDD